MYRFPTVTPWWSSGSGPECYIPHRCLEPQSFLWDRDRILQLLQLQQTRRASNPGNSPWVFHAAGSLQAHWDDGQNHADDRHGVHPSLLSSALRHRSQYTLLKILEQTFCGKQTCFVGFTYILAQILTSMRRPTFQLQWQILDTVQARCFKLCLGILNVLSFEVSIVISLTMTWLYLSEQYRLSSFPWLR